MVRFLFCIAFAAFGASLPAQIVLKQLKYADSSYRIPISGYHDNDLRFTAEDIRHIITTDSAGRNIVQFIVANDTVSYRFLTKQTMILSSLGTGPKGDKGDTGDQGAQGDTGATGATGPAPNLSIGTVQSTASAAVTVTGTNPKLYTQF